MPSDSVSRNLPLARRPAFVVLLLALPWAVEGPALNGAFVFDDVTAIVHNEGVHSLAHVDEMIRFWQPSEVSYRPLRYLSYAVDWVRGGGSPRAFHRTNLLLHGLAAVLLYLLLLQLLPDRRLAPWAALLWLVHPLQVESVAYIAGRKDLLCALFSFVALHGLTARMRASGKTGRAVGGAVFLGAGLLAFLAKEMALVLPLLAFTIETMRRPGGDLRDRIAATLRRGRVFYGLIVLAGAAGLVDKLILAPGTKLPFHLLSDPFRNLPLAAKTLAFYLRKSLWPWPLVADLRGLFPAARGGLHGWGTFWNGGGWPATLVGLALGAGLLLATRRSPRARTVRAGLLLFAIAALPVLNLVPLNEPAAEHDAYLPLAALSVALVAAAAALPRPRGRYGAVLAGAVLLILAAASHVRSRVWRDSAALWSSVVAVNDGSDRAWNDLGLTRLDAGDRERACRDFERALAVAASPAPETYANLIRTLREIGDPDAALRAARQAAARLPDDPLALSSAAGAFLAAGDAERARELLDRVASLPGGQGAAVPTWIRDRGLAHVQTGDEAGGERLLREAAAAAPDDPAVLANLGWLYLKEGRLAAADSVLARAVALPDASGVAWRNRAVVLLRLGRAREAAAALDEAAARGDRVPPSLREAVDAAVRKAGAAGDGR